MRWILVYLPTEYNSCMKNQILMKSWLKFQGRTKVLPADGWYLHFANRLLHLIREEAFLSNSPEGQKESSIALTTYLKDCISYDGRGWAQFIQLYHQRYGTYLPFYEIPDSYMIDEVNVEDIRFLLWNTSSGINAFGLKEVENPFDEKLLLLSNLIYDLMYELFEEAPIAEPTASSWLIESKYMEIDQTPVPHIKPDDKLTTDVERFLQASGGNSLMYFLDYSELRHFFVNALGWTNEDESLMPELSEATNLVLYANAKGMIIAPEVAWCFEDKRNKGYNKVMASEEGYLLFCDQGCCPFDLLKYAMANHLIPEAAFRFANGKKLLHEHWDFIARWFLRDYFEGE